MKVRTRFAPSPTGSLHIGGLRTAMYAYALAKHSGGEFVLRIEDTDQKRKVVGAEEEIKNLLTLFGLSWDEYYVQSERLDLYQKAAKKMVEEGYAFYCQCKAKNAKLDGFSKVLRDPCRDKNLGNGAIKLKVLDGEEISFRDFILAKDISWKTSDVIDATLLKSDGFPTYHLAVVVDDSDMGITHVLRGHDWMPSTPIHLLVYKYLGFELPQIGHLTDILDPGGGKLSKRKGSTSVRGLIEEGYLPEAILNFVMLLGWAPKDNREIFSLADFVKRFDSNGFQKANPVFNKDKLDWFNGIYIREKSDEELTGILVDFTSFVDHDLISKVVPLIKERIKTLKEFEELAGFFFEEPKVDKSLLGDNYKAHLNEALEVVEKMKDWNLENLESFLLERINRKKFHTGNFFMDLRIAITGKKFTPPINDSIIILGRDESMKRIKKLV